LPFTSVESQDFQNILNILRNGVTIPSADTIKNTIMATYEKNKKKVQQFLQVITIYKILYW
jgi:hypothetical protein